MQTLLQSSEPQAWVLSLLLLATAIAGLATVVCAVGVIAQRLRRNGQPRTTAQPVAVTALPVGASTALAAITELRPDPRNVVVTPAEPLPAPPALPGYEVAGRPNGAFAVTYRVGHGSVEQVLAAVRAAGVGIRDITTEDPDLEDVFVAMTYGDASRPAPTAD